MTVFFIAAGLLTLVVVLRLLWPLWRGTGSHAVTVAQLNAKVYRDELKELERDLARGQLGDTAYGEARDELQRRLLEDVAATRPEPASSPTASRAGRWTAVALAVLVPIGAAGLYSRVGNPAAIDAADMRAPAPEEVRRAVEHLAEALRQSPDNPQGWLLLGRAYAKMDRLAEAVAAYDHAAPLIQKNPDLLIEQAGVVAEAAGDQLEGRPMALVHQALSMDPKHPMALMMMGVSAYRRGDHAGAVSEWGKLLAVLPQDSPVAQQVRASIDQARSEGHLPATAAASAIPAAAGTVSGEVSLAPALAAQVRPDDVLFIIARPDDGSRAPAAVLRKRVADLPLSFTLDDSMAMMPERTVSKAKKLVLVARISRSGQPMPQPGDLSSPPSEAVVPGTKGIRLVIDRAL